MLIRFKTPNMVERNAKNFCKRKMVFGKVLFRKLLIYYFAHLNILSVPQDLHSHACTSSYTHIYTHRHGFTHTFKYGAHLPDKLAWTLKNLSPDFGPLTPPFPLPVLWSFAPVWLVPCPARPLAPATLQVNIILMKINMKPGAFCPTRFNFPEDVATPSALTADTCVCICVCASCKCV